MSLSKRERIDFDKVDEFVRNHAPDSVAAELLAARKIAADATCDCGYLLPSHGATDPNDHSKGCNYRKSIEATIERIRRGISSVDTLRKEQLA